MRVVRLDPGNHQLPGRAELSNRHAYASLDRISAAAATDIVLIDTEPRSVAIDQVGNLPDLSNRPLRLSSRDLGPAGLRELRGRGTISLVTREDMRRLGFGHNPGNEGPGFQASVGVPSEGGCLVSRAR